MKYLLLIFPALYWLITWILKYIYNFFELIWHFNTSYFTYYNTHFLTLKQLKNWISWDEKHTIERVGRAGLNLIEFFIHSILYHIYIK